MARLVNFLQLPIQKCFYRDKMIGTECDATPPFHVKLNRRGSATIIEWFCINGHMLWKWNSQPVLKYAMQGGDFMVATNILLSGNNFSKLALFFRFMNIGFVSPKTFRLIQNHYLVDSIKDFWEKKRAVIIDGLRAKESVVALADGRMDSPGHTAQFCTYTTMENDSKDIISVVTVDKRQTNRNSVIMEKHAFIQTFDNLLADLNITEIVTDAHMQISALLDPRKGRYKEKAIIHSLDVWHAAKNLTKKLHMAGILKGNSILLVWLKDIINQFWYICQKAQHRDMFNDMWVGVLHHVTGKHEWTRGKCDHGPLDATTSDKELMVPGSPPHEALQRIMFNRRWLKDVTKYLTFRSTSELESFQNCILMYAGKGFAFSPPVYEARCLLAALDYNHHNHRPDYITRKNEKS
ncbi:uncharacterized protein [Nothobranchius furzeri]|uniref:uncharacterized protein n=1 Tax=Nothobranchius furzeri TaxID=105023 RepID=UPI003904D490